MSIHCLICGHQANWRDDGEVKIDDKTWVVIKIFRDNLLGEKVKRQVPLDKFWAHRDCVQKWINECCNGETKIDYTPKKLSIPSKAQEPVGCVKGKPLKGRVMALPFGVVGKANSASPSQEPKNEDDERREK